MYHKSWHKSTQFGMLSFIWVCIMIKCRSALYSLGVMLSLTCVLMLFPMLIDIINNDDTWLSFLNATITTTFISGLLIAATKSDEHETYTHKDAVITLLLFWMIVPITATLPLLYSSLPFDICDCYFETVSALTTTGSTSLYSLNSISRGMIIWKSLLAILGACTFIISSTYITKSIYSYSTSENARFIVYDIKFDKYSIFKNIKNIFTIFFALVFIGTISIVAAGKQNFFEAFFISSSLLSTTGIQFNELTFENDYYLTAIYMLLMLFSGLPIVTIKQGIKRTLNDIQVRIFLTIIAVFSIAIPCLNNHHNIDIFSSMCNTLIEILSSITTNSISATSVHSDITYLLTAIGGCAGSASGGVKIFRIIIIFYILIKAIQKFINVEYKTSNIISKLKVNNDLEYQVITYFVLLIIFIFIGSYALTATGLQFTVAIEYAYSAITNNAIGSLGTIVNSSDIALIPTSTKLLISILMIIGRIELIIIPAVLTKQFWTK